ncbi:MAG: glycosyltransferase [Spirochaetia bacterium]|nr:glycosyltransferase [Spirochaetia bacterium]
MRGALMNNKLRLTLLLSLLLVLMAGLISYRIYLYVYEGDYQSLNADNIIQIEATLDQQDSFQFAVVGNIQNSMRLFEQRIIPLIETNNVDFMVSVGNAVFDGAEAKYRLLHRGLKKLDVPKVMTIGSHEVEDFGSSLFYRHFGPYFFSFPVRDSYFIFLDTTGQTSWKWQYRWLEQELKQNENYRHRFVFMNQSMFKLEGYEANHPIFVMDERVSGQLHKLFATYGVTAVFSAGYPTFAEEQRDGVQYIISGAGGGLLLERDSPYQIVRVSVGPTKVSYENIAALDAPSAFSERIERLKLFFHSFVYMSVSNLLLFLSLIGIIALRLHSLTLKQKHLYRDFSVDEQAGQDSLSIVMFTNNYLPFIGGVPLSIQRLASGLTRLGHRVHIFAPAYPEASKEDEKDHVIRCERLFQANLSGFPIVNLFSPKIARTFKALDCDLVHIHHPFWLCVKALHLARRRHVPIVLTYHTRLERYVHYLPIPGAPLKHLLAHWKIRGVANHCDAIITPTPSTEEYLRNLGVSALIETIPTGIKLQDYDSWTEQQVQQCRLSHTNGNNLLLITVSRLSEEKNLDFLLVALAKVKTICPVGFSFLFVGDGPQRSHLEKRVEELALEQVVTFAGNLPPREVTRIYRAADLFVFASTSETQGMVLVEAMAGGCPVVAVRASGVHDVVKNGYNGLMVPESTDSWAAAVVSLLSDTEKLSALSENSRTFAQTFSEENIAKKVEALYQRVVLLHKAKQL